MQDGQVFVREADVYGPPGAPTIREARKQLFHALAALDRALPHGNVARVSAEAVADALDRVHDAELSLICARALARGHAKLVAGDNTADRGASDRH